MAKKIFISYGMEGLKEQQIIQKFNWLYKYIKYILGDEVEVINSFITTDQVFDLILSGIGEEHNGLTYLGGSICILSQADYIYMSEGADECRGCNLEERAAAAYGIPILKHLSKRFSIDNYTVVISEDSIEILYGNSVTPSNRLLIHDLNYDTFPNFYELSISLIEKYNKERGLLWNEWGKSNG